ncbi:hypothetical protein LguiB_004118 [Lonicera macranthoides]
MRWQWRCKITEEEDEAPLTLLCMVEGGAGGCGIKEFDWLPIEYAIICIGFYPIQQIVGGHVKHGIECSWWIVGFVLDVYQPLQLEQEIHLSLALFDFTIR